MDVIIANTGGFGKNIPMEELSGDQLLLDVEHLLCGAFNMLRAALPSLRKSKAPRVIFMTTTEGVNGGVHESFSNAVAKGAVHSLVYLLTQPCVLMKKAGQSCPAFFIK